MRDFRSLNVWRKAHELTLAVYAATRGFPVEERYGLTSQMRRAGSSIATNIAEGCGRDGEREFARFLRIAAGSASELEYQLLLSRDLELLNQSECHHLSDLVVETRRMIAGLLKSLQDDKTR